MTKNGCCGLLSSSAGPSACISCIASAATTRKRRLSCTSSSRPFGPPSPCSMYHKDDAYGAAMTGRNRSQTDSNAIGKLQIRLPEPVFHEINPFFKPLVQKTAQTSELKGPAENRRALLFAWRKGWDNRIFTPSTAPHFEKGAKRAQPVSRSHLCKCSPVVLAGQGIRTPKPHKVAYTLWGSLCFHAFTVHL